MVECRNYNYYVLLALVQEYSKRRYRNFPLVSYFITVTNSTMKSFYDYNNMSSFNSIGKGIQKQITTSVPCIKKNQVYIR